MFGSQDLDLKVWCQDLDLWVWVSGFVCLGLGLTILITGFGS